MESTCKVCHRKLSNPESIKRGMGPVCAGTAASKAATHRDDSMIADRVQGRLDNEVILCRDQDGIVTNVPHRKVYHSPCGYEWGYGGSGPADLALNILLALVPEEDAWALYQKFKQKFIALMPREGGTILVRDIRAWVAMERLKTLLQRLSPTVYKEV